jgi:hypothetical protein
MPRLLLVVVAVVLAWSVPAGAQRITPIGSVRASSFAGTAMRAIGVRHVALSELLFGAREATLDVLDLDTRQVTTLRTPRTAFLRRYGGRDPQRMVPAASLIAYDPAAAAGLFVAERTGGTRRHWYVELDASTGAITRSARLATLDATEDLEFVGTDVARRTAWFAIRRFAAPPGADFQRLAGPLTLVLHRLDLDRLAFTTAITVALPARPMKSGYEDRVTVHHAADFSRFAVVEYDEDSFRTSPAARVYIVDPDRLDVFAVPALDTTYGVAFSRDGAYLYLASCQTSVVARVDLATRKIDRRVAGPPRPHHAVLAPDGSRLVVVGTARQFAVYDLPDLSRRRLVSHERGLAAHLAADGVWSLDGSYFVVAEPSSAGAPKQFTIARIGD